MAGVSPEQLLERLAKGKVVPGILLLGRDAYLRGFMYRLIEILSPQYDKHAVNNALRNY